jgi:Flp pilus assembly protein TadG
MAQLMAISYSTLRKPDNPQIIDPSTGRMREEWQLYFQQITTRLNAAVGELAALSGDIVGTTDTQTLTNKTIAAPVITETLTAGETLADGDLCYLNSDGEMYLADADAEATADTLLAICTESLTDGNPGTFIIRGRYTTSGLTTGSVYYVDVTAGDWTATAPSATGDIVRIVGYALSTTVLLFMPDNTYVEIA